MRAAHVSNLYATTKAMKEEYNLKKALKEYFGFDTFKSNQEDIVKSLLEGHNVFVLMPTGGGKSLC